MKKRKQNKTFLEILKETSISFEQMLLNIETKLTIEHLINTINWN